MKRIRVSAEIAQNYSNMLRQDWIDVSLEKKSLPVGSARLHCYKPDMRERMRKVMRWAGPRMILYDPIEAIKHLIREK